MEKEGQEKNGDNKESIEDLWIKLIFLPFGRPVLKYLKSKYGHKEKMKWNEFGSPLFRIYMTYFAFLAVVALCFIIFPNLYSTIISIAIIIGIIIFLKIKKERTKNN